MKRADNDICLHAENVSKKFCAHLRLSLFYGLLDVVRSFEYLPAHNPLVLRKAEFWALKDISFSLMRGDILGIIGQNGSGKTTLLRIISGILPSETGEVAIDGRCVSLLSFWAGFHPHMTVKENIFLCGTIFGMKRPEIAQKFDSIIEFSELRDFLRTPMAALTLGMHVRLGFAMIRAVHPEILLIDEVLGAADTGFREKALSEIRHMQSDRAAIFVSHNLEMIKDVCNRLIVLDKGKIVWSGNNVENGLREHTRLCCDDAS